MVSLDKNTIITAIVIGYVALTIIGIKLALARISFSRLLFWVDVVLIPLCIIALIVILFNIITKKERIYSYHNWRQQDYLWDKEVDYASGFFTICLLVVALISISYFYDEGYSDKAIERKAELEKQLFEYQLIFDILTKRNMVTLQNMVLQEVYTELCLQLPDTPCEEVIRSYNTYQELVGYKNRADKIANLWK